MCLKAYHVPKTQHSGFTSLESYHGSKGFIFVATTSRKKAEIQCSSYKISLQECHVCDQPTQPFAG